MKRLASRLGLLLAALALSTATAHAQTATLQKGEITLTKTGDPSRFDLHGYALIDGQARTFDGPATVANGQLTFTVTYKAKSMVGALGGESAQTVTRTFTRDLGTTAPAGTWDLRAGSESTGAIVKRTPPQPGDDPAVVLARTLSMQRSDETIDATKARFGVTPKRWLGFLDDAHGDEIARAVEKAAAQSNGTISPAWLYTVATGEGLHLWVEDGTPTPISGFEYLGTDTFGTRVAALKAKGYIPASFTLGKNYHLDKNVNEKNETVTSATFGSLDDGMLALEAMLRESRDRAIANLKAIHPGVKLTEDDIRFWSYLDYNVGGGRAKQFMQTHPLSWGQRRDGPEPTHNMEGRYNSIVRVATARWLENLGAFAAPAPAVSTATTPHAPIANTPLGGD